MKAKFLRVIITLGVCLTSATNAGDGVLDPSFDGDGKVTTHIPGGINADGRSIVLPDGKIIMGGAATFGGVRKGVLVRYNADGSLDTTFGVDGIVNEQAFNGATDTFFASLALQPDCKIVVGGRIIVSGITSQLLVRYNTDGSLDETFGTGGFFIVPGPGTNNSSITEIVLQSNGKITSTGNAMFAQFDFLVARYNSNGSLDTTFGTNGMTTTAITVPLSTESSANSLDIQSDGKIVVGGYVTFGGARRIALARYTSSGVLDTTFGTNGIVTAQPLSSTISQINFVLVQPDDKIVIAGSATIGTQRFLLGRYNADGTPDTTFGTGGFVAFQPSGATSSVFDQAALQIDGKIVAGGGATIGQLQFATARFHPDGSLDTSFGTAGTGLVFTILGTSDQGQAIQLTPTIQGNGAIVQGGFATVGVRDFGVIRLLNEVIGIPGPISCITQSIFDKYCTCQS